MYVNNYITFWHEEVIEIYQHAYTIHNRYFTGIVVIQMLKPKKGQENKTHGASYDSLTMDNTSPLHLNSQLSELRTDATDS